MVDLTDGRVPRRAGDLSEVIVLSTQLAFV